MSSSEPKFTTEVPSNILLEDYPQYIPPKIESVDRNDDIWPPLSFSGVCAGSGTNYQPKIHITHYPYNDYKELREEVIRPTLLDKLLGYFFK